MCDGQQPELNALGEPQNAEERDLAFLSHVVQGLTSTLELDEVLTMVLEELRQMTERLKFP
ncbi:MAG: hypothetical protein HGB05_17530, partial [Chloroflexi bacterium]|nr:hypothetical protein [Chloroflexota bacterium]